MNGTDINTERLGNLGWARWVFALSIVAVGLLAAAVGSFLSSASFFAFWPILVALSLGAVAVFFAFDLPGR